jgi:hypothetical protein
MAADDRLHGKNGRILLDPTGAGGVLALPVASINKWDLDMSTDKVKVTCFGDPNQVYVQGLPDVKFTWAGEYDPADGLIIFDAMVAAVKPYVGLVADFVGAPTVIYGGKSLLDGKISVDANGAITTSGSGVAAGAWTLPTAA